MRVKVNAWDTDIYPTDEEFKSKSLCNIGAGADTCIWLVVAPTGFECLCLHRPPYLADRLAEGKTVAKKDGCDFVNNLNVQELGQGEHTLDPLVS